MALLEEYLELEKQGLVRMSHKDNRLFQFKYTDRAMCLKEWTPILKAARGIILDKESNIIARPFDKFFNLNENTESSEAIIADMIFSIHTVYKKKYDGSCIITYFDPIDLETPCFATLGSFNSNQAIKAKEMFNEEYYKPLVKFLKRSKEYTHIFEIIYTENKIVVEYGWNGLVYLGSRHIESGTHFDLSSQMWPLMAVIPQHCYHINSVREEEKSNEEGYVLFHKNIPIVKIKYDWYVKAHRVADMSTLPRVFEFLVENGLTFSNMDSLYEGIPEHIITKIDDLIAFIKTKVIDYKQRSLEAFEFCKSIPTRKEQAAFLLDDKYKSVSPIVFAMLDNKDYMTIFIKTLRKHLDI